ncbi:MAG: bifunctional DNA primase/polymerase [Chromatiaceae bacterium]|nr:bifunctional DNA primase/polymerase [Candidatus Thioaporhodococcus sediminis]
MAALLDTALDMAAWGYAVFPVLVSPDPAHPGKHTKRPLVRAWQVAASTDEAAVSAMPWDRATHIGIACGPSGICVLDIDDPSQKAHLPPLDVTVRQTTISGGEHYFYRAPAKFRQANTTHAPRPGVDIRGDGGFVVWYGLGEWADYKLGLADWPFSKPISSGSGDDRDQPAAPDTGAYAPTRVRKGGRNQDLIRAAGWWMRQNPLLDTEWLVTALLGHTERWHDPPLSSAEVRQVAESAQRWHSEAPDLGGWIKLDDLPQAEPPQYLLGEWLVQGSVNLIFSRAGVGKTGVVVRLLASLCSGRAILGWQPQSSPYTRKIGWVNGELPPYQFDAQVRSILAPWGQQIATVDTRRANLMERRPWLLRLAERVGLLVLDTRSSLFRLDDVNSDKSWEVLNDLLREIADMGVTVFLATHAGKPAPGMPQSSFGSSAQEWFMDSIISLSRPSQGEWNKKDGQWATAKASGAHYRAAFHCQCEKNRHGRPFEDMLCWWGKNAQGTRVLNYEPAEE